MDELAGRPEPGNISVKAARPQSSRLLTATGSVVDPVCMAPSRSTGPLV